MANFGLFGLSDELPRQEYKGDYLVMCGDSVCIMARDNEGIERVFAVIRLADGQSVKEVKN
ncbi:MAG: hypothetical protein ACM3WP_01975 [Acidobacteriota bacterium]